MTTTYGRWNKLSERTPTDEWREDPYNSDGTMTLWHGAPLRFRESILAHGILPRCDLPVSDAHLQKKVQSVSRQIGEKYGAPPTPEMVASAVKWARRRLGQTKGCVYTSGSKTYAQGNCLAGDEWIHGIAWELLHDLQKAGSLPREFNVGFVTREFYPDTTCALFELRIPIDDVKAVPENVPQFEVYEEKYDTPTTRKLYEGTDAFYGDVFGEVHLPRIDPQRIVAVHTPGNVFERVADKKKVP